MGHGSKQGEMGELMIKSRRPIVARALSVVASIAALLSVGSSVVAGPVAQTGDELFADVAVGSGLAATDDPTIVRTRFVDVNLGLLAGAGDRSGEASGVADVLTLNLFEDVTLTALCDHVEANPSGSFSWIGHLQGVEYGQVILVVRGEMVMGDVSMPGAFYQVRYAGGGVHAIHEIDQTAFPPELPPIPVEAPQSDLAELPLLNAPLADDGSTIDLLVVYTDDARSAEGGSAAIETLIDLAVSVTNQSYANSGINQRLNLVHTAEISYDEGGFSWETTLNRLRNPADGYMDSVYALRNYYCADEVALIVNNADYCGIAYVMTYVHHTFADSAFAVVSRSCATSYYSLAHELGHNMGARHDWYVDDEITPYSYSHGYVFFPGRWRTIMAYDTECNRRGDSCARLQYWSNPNVMYGGYPMGVPAGTSTGCTMDDLNHPACDADARLTLNNTAATVANFRDSSLCASGTVGPLVYAGHAVDDDADDQSDGDGDAIIDCGEAIELFVDVLNQGSETATGVNATLSTSDPYVAFPYNSDSGYPDVPAGETATNSNDYDLQVDPGTPDGHIVRFNLNVTASNGGPWSNSFDIPVTCTGYGISGHVRDAMGSPIGGVTVDFNGARPAVTTDGSGYYSQSGFANGNYIVAFGLNGYAFSPVEDQVTVSEADVTHDVTAYPFDPAGVPFVDGFEDGELGDAWAIETDYEGRVRVEAGFPHAGMYSLLLDDHTNDDLYSHASAILALDLEGQSQAEMGFWWRAFDDETHADDGVFISDDYGVTWHAVFSFTGSTAVFTQTTIDLDAQATAAGVDLNDHFLIKFQFHDDWSIGSDGYAIDDVTVAGEGLAYEGHIVNDDDFGWSDGNGDGVVDCGESIELYVTLYNRELETAIRTTVAITSSDPYITFTHNVTSVYPDIPGGETGTNGDAFDFDVAPDAAHAHLVHFDLDIATPDGGPWADSFAVRVMCATDFVYLPVVLRD
jgi:predicted 3-demethylubiquinone-9 3-methyltransferase (glyoxalase superfamily)